MRSISMAALCASVALMFAPAAHALTATGAKLENSTLAIDSVEADAAGWLVVHMAQNGEAGAHIGHVQVQSGMNENLQIPLDQTVSSGQSVILMLHEDTGTTGTFEFEEGSAEQLDPPAMSDGEPIQTEVTIE